MIFCMSCTRLQASQLVAAATSSGPASPQDTMPPFPAASARLGRSTAIESANKRTARRRFAMEFIVTSKKSQADKNREKVYSRAVAAAN